ncbi:hypothetical protein VQ03_00815 [Methylobacterium tarhaniae]|uniref:Uncharacterized protein n=1 Tax=Methylobacterium tarhaniae TaxID=1187852 RepID=A0A0J6VZZ5_9HYPH|nr:hypothetical protein VQ03_00815 [Methylobacterium tarhaniae]
MTARTCRAPGCGARTSRYGAFCTTHRSRSRRHGHPDQESITTADLKPYLKLVRARIARNEASPLWAECEARWNAVLEHARRVLAAFQRCQAGYRPERIASQEVVKLAESVEPSKVVETTLAVFLLQEQQPRRFRSDKAFRFQLVRRLRGLTDLNAGSWYNHKTGKTHRAYRELTPRAVTAFAQWIIEALGGVALYLAGLERKQEQERQEQRRLLTEALEALQ